MAGSDTTGWGDLEKLAPGLRVWLSWLSPSVHDATALTEHRDALWKSWYLGGGVRRVTSSRSDLDGTEATLWYLNEIERKEKKRGRRRGGGGGHLRHRTQ